MCEGTKRLYLGEGDWGDCIMCESESDSESDDEKLIFVGGAKTRL